MHNLAGAHFSIGTIALMNENLTFFNDTTHPKNVPQNRTIFIFVPKIIFGNVPGVITWARVFQIGGTLGDSRAQS
jgi:hypothetical protein